MQAQVFKGNGVVALEDRPHPVVDSHNTVLVELMSCGICGTDMNILSVPPLHTAHVNTIIGHEGIGEVVEILDPATSTLSVGDRVVIAPRILCGNCIHCRRGLQNQCLNYSTVGTTRDGAFATHIALPETALYTIDKKVDIDDAVFFEPLSCVVGAMKRVHWSAGSTVVIVGGGPMGALFALLCNAMGAGIIHIIDVSESRLDFYSSMSGVCTHCIRDIPKDKVRTMLQEMQADIAIDAVGNQMSSCVASLRRGGQAILFGLKAGQKVEIEQYAITRNDITVHGAFVGLNPFVDTINILETGVVRPSVLVSHKFSLGDLDKGIAHMRNAEGMKILITIKGEGKA